MKPGYVVLLALGLVAGLVVTGPSVSLAADTATSGGGVANGKISFVGQNGPYTDIFVMDAGGDNAVNITNTPDAYEDDPSWSPDGKQIALAIGVMDPEQLFVMNADGTNITGLSSRGFAKEPTWSPNGEWIAFEENEKGSTVFKVRADGTGETVVMYDAYSPAWSPDGSQLAVVDLSVISLIDPDGSNRIYLPRSPGEFDMAESPAWSPDGSKIAFEGTNYPGMPGVWVMNRDGSNPVLLAPNGTNPTWSPDGSLILFGRNNSPYVVPAAGGTPEILPGWSLPAGVTTATGFDWQPLAVPSVTSTNVCEGVVFSANGDNLAGWWLRWDDVLNSGDYELAELPVTFAHGRDLIVSLYHESVFVDDLHELDGTYVRAATCDTPRDSFTDDDDSVFEADVEWMAGAGITKGCNPPTNDRFCPDGVVTRGQMAAFLVRALGLTDRLDDPFTDDDGSIFEADIERLAAAGITKGCNPSEGNTKFCPDAKVTREQMAAFLVRALGYTDAGGGDLFIDDDASIFEGDIDRLATAGVTKGCNPPTNDRFCPSNSVTRGQMAAFLHRALG